jgi:hypothetical protein
LPEGAFTNRYIHDVPVVVDNAGGETPEASNLHPYCCITDSMHGNPTMTAIMDQPQVFPEPANTASSAPLGGSGQGINILNHNPAPDGVSQLFWQGIPATGYGIGTMVAVGFSYPAAGMSGPAPSTMPSNGMSFTDATGGQVFTPTNKDEIWWSQEDNVYGGVSNGFQSGQTLPSYERPPANVHYVRGDYCGEQSRAPTTRKSGHETTVMLRGTPLNLKLSELEDELNANHRGLFDVVYFPRDFGYDNDVFPANLGYAFINFTSNKVAKKFRKQYEGQQLCHRTKNPKAMDSAKFLTTSWATKHQGREEFIEFHQNTSIMHESVRDDCKPHLYNENGERTSFPPPLQPVQPPKTTPGEKRNARNQLSCRASRSLRWA